MLRRPLSVKGVSPVIAELLLILIAVAMAVTLYAWAVGYAGLTRPATPETTERLKIEGAELLVDESGSLGNPLRPDVKATLYVRNVGGSDVNLTEAYLLTTGMTYINTTLGYGASCGIMVDGQRAADKLLEAGGCYRVEVYFLDTEATPGRSYVVKLVTSLG
ncbi:MAG: hypothetical protein DRJ97_05985, partial [Thermoprotei archaeon]